MAVTWGESLVVDAVSGLSRCSRAIAAAAVALSSFGCPQLLKDEFTTVRPGDAEGAPPTVTAEECAPFALCDDACVDVQSNPRHCGECAAAIGENQICSLGQAISASDGCGLRTLCAGGCVDPQTHPFYCGSCDLACKLGARCNMGRCECAPPTAKDCGADCRQCCADADCPMDKRCFDGVCLPNCVAPSVLCMGRCAQLLTDPRHCGRCGSDCGPGRMCADGACVAL